MCGIIGIIDDKEACSKLVSGLTLMQNRGIDGYGLVSEKEVCYSKNVGDLKTIEGSHVIGHCLHAMVSHVEQPLQSKETGNRFAFNGEIYNWKELKKRYNLNAENDTEVVFQLLEKGFLETIPEILDQLDGVFAFVYWREGKIVLARDLIGVKPIWISLGDGLAFASEKKALTAMGLTNIEELNPRLILYYDVKEKKRSFLKRDFFVIEPEHTASHEELVLKTKELVIEAIKKRIPDQHFGILFSGGLESSIMALVCKQLGKEFTCYTSSLAGSVDAPDLMWAKKVANALDLDLKFKELSVEEVESELKVVVPLIEDSNVIKVGVGLTNFVASSLAKEDGMRVVFSGAGAEEVFAGYVRHKKSHYPNKECLSGLRRIYERDLYRDDVVTMNNNLELRVPFLDKSLASFGLRIPTEYKIGKIENEEFTKLILREVAISLGLPKEFAYRPRKAAQYGSKFDKAITQLAKKSGATSKSKYLRSFFPHDNVKLGVLMSGGKDSWYAACIMHNQNYELSCLVSISSQNKESYMFHTPNIDLVKLQSKASGIPLVMHSTKGEKEKELVDLKDALSIAKKEHGIEGVVAGALFSSYQRERIEKVCEELGLKVFSPLWHMDQELEMRNLLDEGFKVSIVAVAGEGLDEHWLGKSLETEDIDALVELREQIGLNVAGEGGEFESFVTDCPLFTKKIEIVSGKKHVESENTGMFEIEEAKITEKF